MDSDQQPKGHITIQKGLSFPPLEKCTSCCLPGLFHCPFCSPAFFKPAKRSKVVLHLEIHLRRAIYIGEYTVHKCGMDCLKRPHYHCVYCFIPLPNNKDYSKHFSACQEVQKKIDSNILDLQVEFTKGDQTKEQTFGESIESSNNMESDDNSESEEIIFSLNSQDKRSQAGISNNSASRFVSRSTGMHSQPPVSKCDQMIQTNIEKPQDCDEFYFMNLAKLFKKLSPNRKAEVRMKIERILFEAEFR